MEVKSLMYNYASFSISNLQSLLDFQVPRMKDVHPDCVMSFANVSAEESL